MARFYFVGCCTLLVLALMGCQQSPSALGIAGRSQFDLGHMVLADSEKLATRLVDRGHQVSDTDRSEARRLYNKSRYISIYAPWEKLRDATERLRLAANTNDPISRSTLAGEASAELVFPSASLQAERDFHTICQRVRANQSVLEQYQSNWKVSSQRFIFCASSYFDGFAHKTETGKAALIIYAMDKAVYDAYLYQEAAAKRANAGQDCQTEIQKARITLQPANDWLYRWHDTPI